METDRFGNPIDPGVGYARGELLRSSTDEVRRLRHGQRVAAAAVRERGAESIGIFTGNPRHFPLQPGDIPTLCEEWVGPGMFTDELREVAIRHLGGDGTEDAAVFNRTSAGIVAGILALSDGRPVVSVVPDGDRSHASVIRGCALADVPLVEVSGEEDSGSAIRMHRPALVVVTTVTSTLARLTDDRSAMAIIAAREARASVLMDEAYGARLRPVLHDGAPSLRLGADLAVTNTDKAGLTGPRAGVMAGRPDVLVRVLARASELGMEARAPVAAGALRSLQSYDPEALHEEARDGAEISDALVVRYGEDMIVRSDLGPMIDEQDVLELVLRQAGHDASPIVPAEATTAVGMRMLRSHGILTVNTHGQPGGRVSIRLKPTAGAMERVGGPDALRTAFDTALREVGEHLDDRVWMARVLFGEGNPS